MIKRITLASLAATFALCSFAPARAETTKPTPGAPCEKSNGNPCDGNNGNPSPEGNVGETVKYDRKPLPFTIARPGNARGAFINQIGDQNLSAIRQSETSHYARIDQDGDRNDADVGQTGSGAHYALVTQTGDSNALDLAQSGAGAQVAFVQQYGNFNQMALVQQGGTVSSGVAATQTGNLNEMSLLQSGSNNQARLIQNGSGNDMSASQTGGNNQLTWTQTGDNLSDLSISQTGGQALQVTQSR